MRVTIFGANGRTGIHAVREALENGHQVTAFVRIPALLPIQQHPNLKILQGDVLNPENVEQGVMGQDAILCLLGVSLGTKAAICSLGTLNILHAMKKHQVQRFLTVTGLDMKNLDHFNFFQRAFIFLFSLLDKAAIVDKGIQEKIIMQSKLQWTIVRPPWLTHGPKTGVYQEGQIIRPTLLSTLSRADLAHFLIRQLGDSAYIQKDVTIQY